MSRNRFESDPPFRFQIIGLHLFLLFHCKTNGKFLPMPNWDYEMFHHEGADEEGHSLGGLFMMCSYA